jgi:hypothetical protein
MRDWSRQAISTPSGSPPVPCCARRSRSG